jgi:predicted PurR-regulated permease PerM
VRRFPGPTGRHALRRKNVVTTHHVHRAVLLAAGLVVMALLVSQLMTLALAVVIAIILALPLAAAADAAQRRGLPRALGASLALLSLAGIITGLALVLVPEFIDQVRQFSDRLPSILSGAQRRLSLQGIHVGSLSADVQHLLNGYARNPLRLAGPLSEAGGAAAVLALGVVVIMIVAFSLAVDPEPVLRFGLCLVPLDQRARVHDVLRRVRSAWLGWMTAVGLDMLVLGGLLWLGMVLVGLPFAIGFATFSALMTVIPNYGSVVSAVPPILAGLSQSPSKGVLVLAVYLIVNQIEGNLLLPLIMARTVDMHPAVVSIGLLIMAALFGLIGVFIAIPLLSLVFILAQALWIEPQESGALPFLAPGPGP